MTSDWSGPSKGLVQTLQSEFEIPIFVETGTAQGHTASWASQHFDKVTTIELGEELYQVAKNNYGHIENIEFISGKSQDELPFIVSETEAPVLFWLDAHYSLGITGGEAYECPLIEELEAIQQANVPVYMLIDDARNFLMPPPPPYSPEDWPTIDEIVRSLDEVGTGDRYTVVYDNTIISVPQHAKEIVEAYVRQKRTTESKLQRGVAEIRSGLVLSYIALVERVARSIDGALLKKLGLYPIAKRIHDFLSVNN